MPEEIVETKLPFAEYLENPNDLPNGAIVEKLDNNETPFKDNVLFSYNPSKMTSTEYVRCVDLYNDRGNNETAMHAMGIMENLFTLEEPHIEELQDLAINLVTDMYNVPDDFDLRAFITKNPDEESECCDSPDELRISDERKLELQPEIEKRRILNSIVHGAAVYQWTSAYYLVAEQLDAMNPELLPSYNKLSALVNYWNWKFYAEGMAPPVCQGKNQINIEEKKIEGKALNFPVLIHEMSKGVIDFIVSKGIPGIDKVTPDELRYIYQEADRYADEQWHYFFGPTLWSSLLSVADVTSHDLPPIISKMSEMEYDELSNFCIDVVFHPEELGKKQMDIVKKRSY